MQGLQALTRSIKREKLADHRVVVGFSVFTNPAERTGRLKSRHVARPCVFVGTLFVRSARRATTAVFARLPSFGFAHTRTRVSSHAVLNVLIMYLSITIPCDCARATHAHVVCAHAHAHTRTREGLANIGQL